MPGFGRGLGQIDPPALVAGAGTVSPPRTHGQRRQTQHRSGACADRIHRQPLRQRGGMGFSPGPKRGHDLPPRLSAAVEVAQPDPLHRSLGGGHPLRQSVADGPRPCRRIRPVDQAAPEAPAQPVHHRRQVRGGPNTIGHQRVLKAALVRPKVDGHSRRGRVALPAVQQTVARPAPFCAGENLGRHPPGPQPRQLTLTMRRSRLRPAVPETADAACQWFLCAARPGPRPRPADSRQRSAALNKTGGGVEPFRMGCAVDAAAWHGPDPGMAKTCHYPTSQIRWSHARSSFAKKKPPSNAG